MRRNGLLIALLSLVLVLGAVSAAAGRPRHSRHHAKAVSAEKGGNSDFGHSQGKDGKDGKDDSGSPSSEGNGNSGHGNANNSEDSSPGNGPGRSDAPAGGGNGNGSPSDSNGPGNGGDAGAPGKSGDKPGDGPTPDATIKADVPVPLLGAPDIPLAILPAEFRPRVATDVLAAPQGGQVLIQDGAGDFVPMDAPGRVPVGAFVDATQGVVTIVDRQPGGGTQTAVFAGAKFQVRQTSDGTTALVLRGSSFRDICGSVSAPATDGGPGARIPNAGVARARSKKVVRSLWASDHGGKYQTYGRNSVATVRGTVWQTVDRCDGTLVRVAAGEVVVHDRRKHKDVVVTAGHSYLARDIPG